MSRALDVVAVRCGLRAVLATASCPSRPRRAGRAVCRILLPITAMTGPAAITPMNSSEPQNPIAAAAACRASMPNTPSPMRTTAMMIRRFVSVVLDRRPGGAPRSVRSAPHAGPGS